jgi:DNA-binding response OmpR family regulator
MASIFLISYDAALARTRELLLRHMGHHVTCAEGFAEAFRLCEEQPSPSFDLMILGHSIPHEDKRAIIRRLTQTCPCPVLALTRINEQVVAEADRSVDPMDAEAFVAAVEELLTTD